MPDTIIKLTGVSKSYKTGDTTIMALEKTDLELSKGEVTLIMGPSGSGKTTLLSIIGCVIYPSTGEVFFLNNKLTNLKESELAAIRLKQIGFVFQQFNLLEPLSALENVMQPMVLQGLPGAEVRQRAQDALGQVGLLDRMKYLPKKLSGGQKQRVAIARALVTNPNIVLCDEPTASLDAKSASIVMEELQQLARQGKAVIIVTHDLRLRKFADRILYVEEGKVSTTISNEEDYK
jgi:putative ABC transport system ATP-binding protein